MESFNAETFTVTLALIGLVIVVSALLSGAIDRSGLPQVAVFLAIGALLGTHGLGYVEVGLDSPVLRVVSSLSLALVLFTDAVTLNLREVRKHARLAALLLGPGTLATAAIAALAGWWLLGLAPAHAVILGAALASTDPVLLRGVLRRPDLPADAKQGLVLESGLNDIVLLPIVLVAMTLASGDASAHTDWAKLLVSLFLLGPGAGVAIGLLAVGALDLVRRKLGVRRDYESLYSIGVAFTAYAAAESVHGSGFLAAFAAGMTVAALDVELCDCFLDYGEATAEMLLLFAFVLLGGSLIWTGLAVLSWKTALFAAAVLLVRLPTFLASLLPTNVGLRSRVLIAWFGPRGLSSLLLVLLAVFAGMPGSEPLFALCSLVVLVSVVVHGGSPFVISMCLGRRPETAAPEAAIEDDAASAPVVPADTAPVIAPAAPGTFTLPASPEMITLGELARLHDEGAPLRLLDVRTARTYDESDELAKGAVRLDPENAVRQARVMGLPADAYLVLYCT